jgi:hypothetical protein
MSTVNNPIFIDLDSLSRLKLMTKKMLNIPYLPSIEIDYVQLSFIVLMEIDGNGNRQYFRLPLNLDRFA